jgi:taurine dioxygenase
MITVEPTGKVLGARVPGVDLSQTLSDEDFRAILVALGTHGVLCFPNQTLTPRQQRDFSQRLGKIQYSLSGKFNDPEVPEVGTLSNITENGKPIGLADAGQDWHTDMSYNELIGFSNVLYGIKIPYRDGKPLGDTVFANMHAAYEGLDDGLKQQLQGMTATHDFNKFWEEMRRRPGSTRPPLTPEQRAKRPPATHPVFMPHPITGRTVLYCNPGYVIRINELPEAESDAVLGRLFAHQLQQRYIHAHHWTEGDVLMWDHIGTLHNAIPDYGADEHRLIKRCQVMADRVFDPDFVRQGLLQAAE